jgi:hypothetical protein
MRKPGILLIFLFATFGSASAQDRMVLRDSSLIECKVEEVAEEKIRYRQWTNLQGPLYSIDKGKVSHLIYQNGVIENLPQPCHVAHSFMFRLGSGLWTPINGEVRMLGGKGLTYASGIQISAYMDQQKKVSLSTSFYAITGELEDFYYQGTQLDYFSFAFNIKWDYHWSRWPSGSLYSGLGGGLVAESFTFSSPNHVINPKSFREDGAIMGYQLTAIGLQYTPLQHIGLFSELGPGYEGFFKFGLQFHW